MTNLDRNRELTISGDFASVFDHEDHLAMLNSRDEAAVVLKAHLILEELLNVWTSKVTGAEDLFAGGFVPFKTKLNVSENLGLSPDLCKALGKFNDVRNKYSHKRKYSADLQVIESLAASVDGAIPDLKISRCCEFVINSSGVDASGIRHEVQHLWDTSENGKKFLVILIVLVLKLTHWMQNAFNARGVSYTLITSMPTHSQNGP